MIKFFRKHTKKLLAVFMALLLVVWLGGSALESMLAASTSDRVFANTAYGDIVELDQRIANSQTNLLDTIGVNWKMPLFGRGQREPLGVTEWILLAREAERYGIKVRRVEAQQFLASPQLGRTEDVILQLAKRNDVKVESFYDAAAQFLAIFQVANMTLSTGTRSEAEVRLAARNELEKVKINLVALRASSLDTADTDFSDAELEAQFNEYRDREPGGGLNFGYVQTAQVKVQYFRIDIEEVAANVRVLERTLESRAKEYWRKNRESAQFRKPPEPVTDDADDADQPEGPVDPAAEPEEPESPYFETFADAREAAIRAVRREFATKEIDDISGWLLRQLSEPWYDAPKGDDSYKIGPADVVAPDHYAGILDRIPAGLKYGNAVTIHTSDFFNRTNMGKVVPMLARASSPSRGTTGAGSAFRDVVFRTQGIEPIPTQPGAATAEYLARGQTFPQQVRTFDGTQHVFRVIDVKPSGPAESMSEVRDQVTADLRLKRAFVEAERLAERLANLVGDAGLKAAFDGDDELTALVQAPSGYYSPAPLARRRQGSVGVSSNTANMVYVSGVGTVDGSFIERCFELGKSGAASKIARIPVKDSASVVVVEWVETEPLREDVYEAEHRRLVSQIGRGAMVQAAGEWLDPVRIRDRNGFSFPTQ